jgi:hypothetical protein
LMGRGSGRGPGQGRVVFQASASGRRGAAPQDGFDVRRECRLKPGTSCKHPSRTPRQGRTLSRGPCTQARPPRCGAGAGSRPRRSGSPERRGLAAPDKPLPTSGLRLQGQEEGFVNAGRLGCGSCAAQGPNSVGGFNTLRTPSGLAVSHQFTWLAPAKACAASPCPRHSGGVQPHSTCATRAASCWADAPGAASTWVNTWPRATCRAHRVSVRQPPGAAPVGPAKPLTAARTCAGLQPHSPHRARASPMAAPEKCLRATEDAGSTLITAPQLRHR